MSVGIYKIENLTSHKVYIGQSVRIETRFREHCHNNKTLIDKTIQQEGKENFSFTTLEECSVEELDLKEKFYIQKYNSLIPNGYNIASGGTANHELFLSHSPEEIQALKQDLKNSTLSFEELGQKYHITQRAIYYINDGTYHHSDQDIYPIRQVLDLTKKIWVCQYCGKSTSKGYTRCRECSNKIRYKDSLFNVISRDELKNLIRNTPFTQIGKQFGVSDNAVRKWCDKYNLPRSSQQIKKYSDDEWAQI